MARFSAHNANKPVNILGMRLYASSLATLSFLLQEIFVRREYAFLPEGNTPFILDCGSNIGISILFFKKLFPQAKVIGFEPDKSMFELLSRNVSENGLSDVSLYNVALSSTIGEATFFSNSQLHLATLKGSLLQERIGGETQQVPCVTLSSFIHGPVDLLKIDIEGAEMGVMQEVAASGALKGVRAIVMEYHHHIRTEESLSEMLRLLEDNSFRYDLSAELPPKPCRFQDIMLRAYGKPNTSPV
ncbi:FkbM family methyltransferase [Acidicapsa acidisoli]|uniref:FkbM family methyltransferase n=1 Tax=Acidicapsa acidisoli TaxID=1615681 RepID=UPI0021E0122C|nr:FkbM family methyltransferase [Acidicapsa acidisoli]